MDARVDTAKAEHEPQSCCQRALEKILHCEESGTTVYSGGMWIRKDRSTRNVLEFWKRAVKIEGVIRKQNKPGLGLTVRMVYLFDSNMIQKEVLHSLFLLMVINVLWNIPIIGIKLTASRHSAVYSVPSVLIVRKQLDLSVLRERLRIKKLANFMEGFSGRKNKL